MLKKIVLIVGVVIVIAVVILGYLMFQSSTPLSKIQATEHLEKYFSKIAKSSGKDNFSGAQVQVFSGGKDLNFTFSGGAGRRIDSLEAQTPFHVASVGKLMTSTLIYQLIDENSLAFDQPIAEVLPGEMLENLFVFEGKDYKDSVTVEQLLAHTSGVADYFGGPVKSGMIMAEHLSSNPDTLWTPQSLLAFSKDNQVAVNAPGKGYHYSDTGYVLLGFIVEEVTGQSFEAALMARIFEPLKMDHTYMALCQDPIVDTKSPIADLWLNGAELGDGNSLSVDWAGGGLISTLDDLSSFSLALHGGKLIGETSLKNMFSDRHKFEQGIFTGAGGMTVHFEKFFPLLKLPKVNGHIGILSTHVFYDASTDTHIVMNFGSTDKMVASFTALIEIMNTLLRIR